jgi:hypothetical protein
MISVQAKRFSKTQTIGWASLLLIAGLILYWVNPLQQLAWLRCPVNLLTGLYCPGCGSLRAIHVLLHGDLLAAISNNLLAVIALPVLLGIGIRDIANNLQGRTTPTRIPPLAAWSVFWIVIGFAIVRNLPIEALYFLRP